MANVNTDVAAVLVDGWTITVEEDYSRAPGFIDPDQPEPESVMVIVAESALGESALYSPSYTPEELELVLREQNLLLEHLDSKHVTWVGGCPECDRAWKVTT